ncbi:hydroxypyruvate isomerase family protein [Falsihalocynthiibacter arcticus]|uniref:Isomerase n=1 Tax=Falsihalocynthiibacter arcticus TaxID=1579316 RepID=A0A126UY27_9RHOB|nr:TIM barrel protein [Falsihalocynthiibacter arcticus]AML50968.1 isomerase [Falsihalocynthiibacter arcticus]
MALPISANLGFLWKELSLLEAIRTAKNAGFDAVECHWPYDTDPKDVRETLESVDMRMLGLNTAQGGAGLNGLLAVVGREVEARASIDQAIAYAAAIGTPNVHAMAGFARGDTAHNCFAENLKYACGEAAKHGITILIEPLNTYDAPNYFLQTTPQAAAIIAEVEAPNLKLMFDCYHVQIMEGDLSRRLIKLLPLIGHVQIASVPERCEPDCGEVNYAHIFMHLSKIGYDGAIGAEYKPVATTDAGLGWLKNGTLF